MFNDPLGESYSGGALGGLGVSDGYDSLLRRSSLTMNGSSSTGYAYDAASRLLAVWQGYTYAAVYSYLANSPLVDHILFTRTGASVMTNQNTFDYVNRLTGVSSELNFNYQYNAASQRTKSTLDGRQLLGVRLRRAGAVGQRGQVLPGRHALCRAAV